MDFFKRKLIIVIPAVFLIAVGSINAEFKKLQDGVDKLDGLGYKSFSYGLENYIEHIFDKHFEDSNHTFETFQREIVVKAAKDCMKNQWIAEGTHEDNLEKYYECFLIVRTHELKIQINQGDKWCEEKYSTDSTDQKNQSSLIATCKKELKEDKFGFTFGIDNYVFSLKYKDENKFDGLKQHTQLYVNYLKEAAQANMPTILYEIENTALWSKNFLLEIELHAAGFHDRYDGSPNYENTVVATYKSKCDDEALKENSKKYCQYLSEVYGQSDSSKAGDPKKLPNGYGTHDWCKDLVTEMVEGPTREDVCEANLQLAGFHSQKEGLEHYIERVFNGYFDSIDKSRTVDSFQQDIIINSYQNCLNSQWIKEGTLEDNLEKYYTCYLTTNIRNLPIPINQGDKWCEENFTSNDQEEKDPIKQQILVATCKKELIEDKFTFTFGIDNYGFSVRARNENRFDGLKPSTQLYIYYLEGVARKNLRKLMDTINWCKLFNYEVELHAAGFHDRYDGSPNYEKTVVETYKSNCNDESLTRTSKKYCQYLSEVYTRSVPSKPSGDSSKQDSDLKKLQNIPGTYDWSLNNLEILEARSKAGSCLVNLKRAGYEPSNDGLTNYTKDFQRKISLMGDKTALGFTENIRNAYITCKYLQWMDLGIVDDYEDQYYTCYLIIFTRYLPDKISNAIKWCEENYSKEVPEDEPQKKLDQNQDSNQGGDAKVKPQAVSQFEKCKEELNIDQFGYAYGIDSYVHELDVKINGFTPPIIEDEEDEAKVEEETQTGAAVGAGAETGKTDDEAKVEEETQTGAAVGAGAETGQTKGEEEEAGETKPYKFKDSTVRYMGYLESFRSANNDALQNTKTWCDYVVCEKVLHKARFDDRYDGTVNYTYTVLGKLNKDCDSLYGLQYQYCTYLISVLGDSNLEATYDEDDPRTIAKNEAEKAKKKAAAAEKAKKKKDAEEAAKKTEAATGAGTEKKDAEEAAKKTGDSEGEEEEEISDEEYQYMIVDEHENFMKYQGTNVWCMNNFNPND